MKSFIFLFLFLLASSVNAGVEQEVIIIFRGDANLSGSVSISDAIYIDNYLFSGGPAPLCFDAADADTSGGIGISDVVFILDYLFDGGPAPSPFTVECPL